MVKKMSNFCSNYSQMEVLCLAKYLNYTLAGIGSNLYIYEDQALVTIEQVFEGSKIHAIYVINDLILLKSIKTFCSISLQKYSWGLRCKFICKINCKDWIQDMICLGKSVVGLNTAHNCFQIWNLNSMNCVESKSFEENCILYSCKIIGDHKRNIVVFSGTVFGDILVWAPFFEELFLHKLKGHNGAIFSIDVNSTKNIISTTSDDRSLKIWSVETSKPIVCPKDWKNARIEIIHTLYGHTARIWKCLLISDFYVTIGEDSKLLIWGKNGTLLRTLSLHQSSGIRGLCYFKQENTIATGGEDGGINVIPCKWLISEVQPVKLLDLEHNFSSKICFTNKGLVYTWNGCCILVTPLGKKIIYENTEFKSYCLMETASSHPYIILGSIKGHLVVIDNKTHTVIAEGVYLKGRVYSIHWLDNLFLTCGPEGTLDLWEVEKKVLKNRQKMTLPPCKERWTSCALLENNILVVGDRMGNIYVFDTTLKANPIRNHPRIHSYLGVTDIKRCNGKIFTVGRDGTFKSFDDKFFHSLTYKLPLDWPLKIISYKTDILILGFHGNFLNLWSMKNQEVIASHDCGGGHRSCDFFLKENILTFFYLKKKKVYAIDLTLNKITRLRYGFHGKEINCLRTIDANPEIIITGSEDTTLRISKFEKMKLCTIEVLKTHTSSIRAISVCPINPFQYLIVSAGGKGEIIIWSFDINTYWCRQVSGYLLKNETRNWNFPDFNLNPDTRFMCLDILKMKDGFLVATGCSDCQIRLFMYADGALNLLSVISHNCCVLKIKVIKLVAELFLISTGTNGEIVFWQVASDFVAIMLENFKLHEAGINSFHLEERKPGLFLLATGGDDNTIRINCVSFFKKTLKLLKLWDSSTSHASQITGIKIVKNFIVTTSIDQRIIIWEWSLKELEFKMNFIAHYTTAVSDIQGFDVTWQGDDVLSVWVHGKGVEKIHINVYDSKL